MLRHVDSRELAEWIAYERAYGPIGSGYSDELLANMQELMQVMIQLQCGHKEPEARHYPRPAEIFEMAEKERKRQVALSDEDMQARKVAELDKLLGF